MASPGAHDLSVPRQAKKRRSIYSSTTLSRKKRENVEREDPGQELIEPEQLGRRPHFEADALEEEKTSVRTVIFQAMEKPKRTPVKMNGARCGKHDLPVASDHTDPEGLGHVDEVLGQRLDRPRRH